MRALRADVMLAITVIVLAAIYLFMDANLPSARIGDPLGPKAFPVLVGGGLLLSSLMLLFDTRKKRQLTGDARPEPRTAEEKHVVRVLLAMVAWTALYYFCFERLGYLIATPLFILGLLTYFHPRRHGVNLAVAGGFTIVVYLLFSTLLGVPLPSGLLPI
jgi:putative tricarboxylic transport membrane protein